MAVVLQQRLCQVKQAGRCQHQAVTHHVPQVAGEQGLHHKGQHDRIDGKEKNGGDDVKDHLGSGFEIKQTNSVRDPIAHDREASVVNVCFHPGVDVRRSPGVMHYGHRTGP